IENDTLPCSNTACDPPALASTLLAHLRKPAWAGGAPITGPEVRLIDALSSASMSRLVWPTITRPLLWLSGESLMVQPAPALEPHTMPFQPLVAALPKLLPIVTRPVKPAERSCPATSFPPAATLMAVVCRLALPFTLALAM